jgi:hypothetical protein
MRMGHVLAILWTVRLLGVAVIWVLRWADSFPTEDDSKRPQLDSFQLNAGCQDADCMFPQVKLDIAKLFFESQ